MKEKPSYYAILTADVRYHKDLTPNAKLLYAEITALENMNGRCFANNKYFADLYGVSKTSVSKWIRQLESFNCIKTVYIYKEGSIEIDKRYITILKGGSEEKLDMGTREKLKDNNKRINNNIRKNNKRKLFKKKNI